MLRSTKTQKKNEANNNNNNNNKDFIYRGGHVTAEKLTNLWPSKKIFNHLAEQAWSIKDF